jgi:hypothetical protein
MNVLLLLLLLLLLQFRDVDSAVNALGPATLYVFYLLWYSTRAKNRVTSLDV